MTICARGRNENVHERKNPVVAENYPPGIHGQVAALSFGRLLDYRVDRERGACLTLHPKST